MDVDALRARLSEHGQQHLLERWPDLDDAGRKRLYDDLNSIDLAEMTSIFQQAQGTPHIHGAVDAHMRAIEPEMCASIATTPEAEVERYKDVALEAIAADEVGVLLLAGGQGTRLGVAHPKGMYSVGLPSGKTLYQIQAERILRVQSMARERTGKAGRVPMYIMTSEHTKAPTEDFFARHDFFGLRKEDVVLFEQRMIPCFDFEGKIILAAPDRVARAPDGNGGLYWALRHEGILDDFASRGVKYLHAFCVDNVLVKVADPVFVGYCVDRRAEAANKVVEKHDPSEGVGVVCKVDDKVQVVEYSEITRATSERRDPNGKLTFSAGNICIHFFSAEFLRRVCSDDYLGRLPQHVAKKKIPCVADPRPTSANGIKLEKFVFDSFQFTSEGRFFVWECLRDEEFSPLKNADGPGKTETPTTARRALFRLHRRYVERAGGRIVVEEEEEKGRRVVENGLGAVDDGREMAQNGRSGTENGRESSAEEKGLTSPGNGLAAAQNGCESAGNGHGDGSKGPTAANKDALAREELACEISPLLSYAGEGLKELVQGKEMRLPVLIE